MLKKIGIVGVGAVGSSLAFSLMLSESVREIVLVDINKKKAKGEALDLLDACAILHPTNIFSSDYEGLKNSDLIAITCGINQKEGQTRLDLIGENIKIFKKVLPEILKYISKNTILLVITNPVEILSYVTWKITNLKSSKILGSGTVLDTSRLRQNLANFLSLDPRNIHSYIIGEHGDMQLPLFSLSTISGMTIQDYLKGLKIKNMDKSFDDIFLKSKNQAYEIISNKQATNWGIAVSVNRIIDVILRDQNSILPISTLINDYYGINDIFLSMPAILNKDGVKNFLKLKLSDIEKEKLLNCSNQIKTILNQIKF